MNRILKDGLKPYPIVLAELTSWLPVTPPSAIDDEEDDEDEEDDDDEGDGEREMDEADLRGSRIDPPLL